MGISIPACCGASLRAVRSSARSARSCCPAPGLHEGRDEPRTSFPDEVQELFPGAFQFPFALGVDRRDLRLPFPVRKAPRPDFSRCPPATVPKGLPEISGLRTGWRGFGRFGPCGRSGSGSRGGCGLRRRFRGRGRLRAGRESARTPVVRPARVEPLRIAAEPPEFDRVGLRRNRSPTRRPAPVRIPFRRLRSNPQRFNPGRPHNRRPRRFPPRLRSRPHPGRKRRRNPQPPRDPLPLRPHGPKRPNPRPSPCGGR